MEGHPDLGTGSKFLATLSRQGCPNCLGGHHQSFHLRPGGGQCSDRQALRARAGERLDPEISGVRSAAAREVFFSISGPGEIPAPVLLFLLLLSCVCLFIFSYRGGLQLNQPKRDIKGCPFCSHGNCKELYGRQRNPRTSELPTLLVPTLLRDSMILVW